MATGRQDWSISALVKGLYGTTLVPLGLTADGYMVALIMGDYAGALKTVATDADGLLLTNISKQGLDFLRVRPVYGELKRAFAIVSVPGTNVNTTLVSVAGRGALLGGIINWAAGAGGVGNIVMYVDGAEIVDCSVGWLNNFLIGPTVDFPICVVKYDATTPEYVVGIKGGTTFEQSLIIQAHQATGSPITFTLYAYYALVPP